MSLHLVSLLHFPPPEPLVTYGGSAYIAQYIIFSTASKILEKKNPTTLLEYFLLLLYTVELLRQYEHKTVLNSNVTQVDKYNKSQVTSDDQSQAK